MSNDITTQYLVPFFPFNLNIPQRTLVTLPNTWFINLITSPNFHPVFFFFFFFCKLHHCYGLKCVSPKFLCWSPVIVTVSGNRTFKRVIKVKWGHKGEGLIHRPFTRTSIFIKRGRDTRDAHVHRKGHVRTQWEASCLQAKERGLRRNWLCWYLDLHFQAPEGWGTILLLSKPPSMWYCVVLPLVDYRPIVYYSRL